MVFGGDGILMEINFLSVIIKMVRKLGSGFGGTITTRLDILDFIRMEPKMING